MYAPNIRISLDAPEKGVKRKDIKQREKRATLSGPVMDGESVRQASFDLDLCTRVSIQKHNEGSHTWPEP